MLYKNVYDTSSPYLKQELYKFTNFQYDTNTSAPK